MLDDPGGGAVRLKLTITKIGHTWRWFYEDWDRPYLDRVLDESPEEYATWQAAEAAGLAVYPDVPDVLRLTVGGHGTAYEDSL